MEEISAIARLISDCFQPSQHGYFVGVKLHVYWFIAEIKSHQHLALLLLFYSSLSSWSSAKSGGSQQGTVDAAT